ncbi:MAG: M28 family peptidase [Gemmatimonadales bacterium]|nr:M28 family peptidase [Gemmatimonadales bacterium]NIN10429.1 M28 family peptidase [Gemmatimonadales bacterium]NIN49221.1 M28 family peptidase [Gemmatimonadales bacterium]NIP06685.1 M28 family peptidase [Gemmatimonadales bacterium]NIR00016.1 M28 family peptidase [Gemmatimonadales bacterium]
MLRPTALLSLALALTLGSDAVAQSAVIDTLAIRAHTRFLSHDMLRGRGTASPGERLAALYIASQCVALGLQAANGDYMQSVPLELAHLRSTARLLVAGPALRSEFRYPADFTPNVGRKGTLVDFAGRAAYVGGADDIRAGLGALELDGKVAVTLGPLRGAPADTLAARGAAGMIHLIGEPEAYELYVQSRGTSRMYHRDADLPSSSLPKVPSVIAGPRVAQALLAGTPVVRGAKMLPQPLPWTAEVHMEFETEAVAATNVACVLPGADPQARDTAIAFAAHYDHLGVGVPDAAGDSVFNGFSDNAAGVAMLLAIGQALANTSSEPMRHSTLLLFFSAEEKGLLGSDYYVERPMWPLERTLAVINLDAGAPPAPPVSWQLAGVDSTGLGAVAIGVAQRRGWRVTTSRPRPISDFYPFTRRGVPALLIIPGPDPYEGLTADSSKALRGRWDQYHKPGDEWADDFPFAGLARYAEFAYLIAQQADRGAIPVRARR